MSRRKRATLSPSLFPFLAVLVCTLGTLILLLALVAQNATDSAQAQAKNAAAQKANDESEAIARRNAAIRQAAELVAQRPRVPAEKVDQMIAEEEFRTAQFVAMRDKQTADLEQRRDQLGHVESHINRIRVELKQISDEVDRVIDGKPSPAVDQTMLASYRKQIDEEKETLDELKSAGPKTPRVVIVPHKGPNGTDRRPIYLECDETGLTIWPEGTRISLSQLADSDTNANPLDAALRVVRRHAMQNYGDTTPPYPLLVVRPDGIETYALARAAMDAWDDQFGYELVPGEVKLAYNAPDANLKRELETTIARAVAKQSPMIAFGQGNGSGRGGGSISGSAYTRGTANGTQPRGSAGTPRVLSAAQLDRTGRSNGFHTERGTEDFSASGYGQRRPNRSAGSPSVTNSYTGANSSSPNGSGAIGRSATDPNAIDPQTQQKWANDMADAAGELRQQATAAGGSFGPGPVTAGDVDLNSLLGGNAGDNESGSGESGSGELASGELGSGESKSAGPNASAATSRASAGSTGTGGTQASGSPQSQPAGDASTEQTAQQTGQQSGNASGDTDPSQAPPPNAQSQSPPPRDLVRRQGQNWAVPRQAHGIGGNTIVRNMRVQCYGDRFVLLGSVRGGATEMFGINDGNIERATLELATSVRDRISQWGVAMPGANWAPRLDVEVMPGGEQRFNQLQSLMNGSGVEIIGRQSQ